MSLCCSVEKAKLWTLVEKADLPQRSDIGSSEWWNKLYTWFFESKYSKVTCQVGSNPSEDVQMKNLTQNKVEEYVWKEKQKTSELPIARRFILGSY